MKHYKEFHGNFKVHLVYGEDPNPVIAEILEKNGYHFEEGDKVTPTGPENAIGAVKMATVSEGVIYFNKRPKLKDAGTVAHEVFHLWHRWNQWMCRNINPNEQSISSLEVDAYFFSDVVDWIFECSKKK